MKIAAWVIGIVAIATIMNADGARQAGEPALPGIVVYADANNNGVRDEGQSFGTSDAQGNFSFEVGLGSSTIREDVPGGFTCSFPAGCAYTGQPAEELAASAAD